MIGEWLDHWLDNIAARRVRPRTLESYRSIVRLHLHVAALSLLSAGNRGLKARLADLYSPLATRAGDRDRADDRRMQWAGRWRLHLFLARRHTAPGNSGSTARRRERRLRR
jgi:hypothetical protein